MQCVSVASLAIQTSHGSARSRVRRRPLAKSRSCRSRGRSCSRTRGRSWPRRTCISCWCTRSSTSSWSYSPSILTLTRCLPTDSHAPRTDTSSMSTRASLTEIEYADSILMFSTQRALRFPSAPQVLRQQTHQKLYKCVDSEASLSAVNSYVRCTRP